MEGKLIITITVSGDDVKTNMSAEKLENMDILKQQQVLKACTDTSKRIKRILGMDAVAAEVKSEEIENELSDTEEETNG